MSEKVGLDEERTKRIIQYSMTNGIFKPTRPGYFAHTGMSKAIFSNKYVHAWIGHNLEDVYPAGACTTDILEKHRSYSGNSSETGFQAAFDTKMDIFQYFENHSDRQERFGMAMKSLSLPGGPYDAANVPKTFDFNKLGEATIIDVSTDVPVPVKERLMSDLNRLEDLRAMLAPLLQRPTRPLSSSSRITLEH